MGSTTMRRRRKNFNHTFQIRRRILRRDASLFVGAFEMCGCGFFSSFSF
jgi:hypothetical protein